MREVLSDVRYALRRLRNAPTAAVVIIVTLALGTGATEAVIAGGPDAVTVRFVENINP